MHKQLVITTTLLKQHIAKAVKDIYDKNFLEAVYTIVSKKAEETDFELNTAIQKELNTRKEKH